LSLSVKYFHSEEDPRDKQTDSNHEEAHGASQSVLRISLKVQIATESYRSQTEQYEEEVS